MICRRSVIRSFLLVLAMMPLLAFANDHGGGGGGADPMVFTVNLGKENYLQFGVVLETATPEAKAALGTFKPKIQHRIILLMAGKEIANLRTLAGKKELAEELVDLANEVIGETHKTGVNEALFTSFLIQ